MGDGSSYVAEAIRNVILMSSLRNVRRSLYAASAATMVAAIAVTGAMAGGAASAHPVARDTSASATPAAVPAIPLLTKQSTTILGQPLAYPTQSPAEVSSAIITLLPGQQTGMHRHDAPMYAYILSGAVTVTYDGGITKTYRKGQAIMEAVGTRHNGVNNGDEPVRILVVNMGAEGVANSVKL